MSLMPTKEEMAAEIDRLAAIDSVIMDAFVDSAEDAVHRLINRILATAPNNDYRKSLWLALLAGVAGGVAASFSDRAAANDPSLLAEKVDPAIFVLTGMRERAAAMTPEEREDIDRQSDIEVSVLKGGFTI